MMFWRAAFTAVSATLLLSTGATASASAAGDASASDEVTTMAVITRQSANGCGTATFNYYYEADGDYYNVTISNGTFSWRSSQSTCGTWGQPYAPVLQWKGEQYGQAVDWRLFRRAANSNEANFAGFGGSGFNNLRFRVCNWNTNTGTVGTCGSS